MKQEWCMKMEICYNCEMLDCVYASKSYECLFIIVEINITQSEKLYTSLNFEKNSVFSGKYKCSSNGKQMKKIDVLILHLT